MDPKKFTKTQMKRLLKLANEAGREAAKAASPQMLQINEPAPDGSRYAPFPMCGFAWVKVSPGNCRFANWLRKTGKGDNGWNGGVTIWMSEYKQSVDLKLAHARAMADVFQAAGITAHAGSRLD